MKELIDLSKSLYNLFNELRQNKDSIQLVVGLFTGIVLLAIIVSIAFYCLSAIITYYAWNLLIVAAWTHLPHMSWLQAFATSYLLLTLKGIFTSTVTTETKSNA